MINVILKYLAPLFRLGDIGQKARVNVSKVFIGFINPAWCTSRAMTEYYSQHYIDYSLAIVPQVYNFLFSFEGGPKWL